MGGDGGGGVDLISGLSDDLLLRILALVPDARDVVRTHALSRRWRGLWTGVAALRFDSDSWPAAVCTEAGAAEQYLAFVDDVLTLRAKATTTRRCYAVQDLKISLDISQHETEELVPPSFEAAQGWTRYAVQHEVKSLVLDLYLVWPYVHRLPEEDDDDEDVEDTIPAMALDDLARSAKLETLHLTLGGAKLRLLSSSSTVVFSSLTDVLLEDIIVEGHLLSRLVSPPCCPRLRKLHLKDLHLPRMMEELLLESDTLLELSLGMIQNMQSLELRTPSLQVLHVENCIDLEGFTVSAPRLEDLMFKAEQPLHIVDVHGHLSSVGTLKIQLYSHGNLDGDDNNDTSIHLLQCCWLTKYLEVSVEVLAVCRMYSCLVFSLFLLNSCARICTMDLICLKIVKKTIKMNHSHTLRFIFSLTMFSFPLSHS
jgi:hypothetical protein